MGQDNLENYFKSNFALMHFHHWSLSDLENMMPWERYVYMDLLQVHIREENEKARDLHSHQAAAMRTRSTMQRVG